MSAETSPEIKPQYEIVTTTAGAISIRDNHVNETMHNPVGPWVEANSLYIDQSKLREKILAAGDRELVIFDIGLGAAANALAAIHCFYGVKERVDQKLKIVSFEKNLDLLKFALLHSHRFAHFAGYEAAIETLMKKKAWESDHFKWELRHGDFVELLDQETERPHLVFFDPYSPKMNQDAWTSAAFKKIARLARPFAEGGTLLHTYSQATPIRAAMLGGGLFIGLGDRTGLKRETTEAASDPRLLANPFGDRWLMRWKNSDSQFPSDILEGAREAFTQTILGHPQFATGSV